MNRFILKSNCDVLPEPPENSISDYVLRRIRQTASIHSQIKNPVTGESLKYSDFDVISANVAKTLRKKYGFSEGDTLIYSAHDGAKLHAFLLGVWRAHGIVRSSYPEDTKGGELLERIKESRAKFFLCDETQASDCLDIIQEIPWKVHIIVFGDVKAKGELLKAADFLNIDNDRSGELFINHESGDDGSTVQANDMALILPTSGTTGKSKGAMYWHKVVIKTLALLETLPLNDDPSSPTLFLGKQTHVSGCLIALARITAGHNLLMLSQVSTDAIIQVVRTHRPRSLFLFPKYLTELVEHQHQNPNTYDLESVHFVCTAGMVVTPSLVETAKKLPRLKAFMMCYGMTECGLFTTNVEWVSNYSINNNLISKPICEFPAYSCGKLVPGSSLIVRDITRDELNNNKNDEDDKLWDSALGPGELGELYFKSSIPFDGYLQKPEQTAETLTGSGWIRTGDLGYYDKEGFIFVTDRVKETFKYFNNHISPTEIEQVILRHNTVAEACVLGVPDPHGGDMIARAFVVLRTEMHQPEQDMVEEIKGFVNNLLPSYKQLKGGLFIIPKLPYGKTGKLCREALKNWNGSHS